MRYTVLLSHTLEDLIVQVEAHMQSQWEPQGGLVVFEAHTVNETSLRFCFAQAMIARREEGA